MIEITEPGVIAANGKTHHPIVLPGRREDSVAGTVFEIRSE